MLLLMRWLTNMISGSTEQQQQQLEYSLLKPDCYNWWISKMQSGRQDTLEEWYAINFCFKLVKNTRETYGMIQIVFRLSCMNQASVCELHKRFKEGRESVRDDERCGRSKEIRTPKLIAQINNIMDKGPACVYRDNKCKCQCGNCTYNYSRGTEDAEDFVPRVLREDQKESRCHDSRKMVELINSDSTVLDVLVTCDESWIYCYNPETKRQSSQWKHACYPRPKKSWQSKSTHKLLMIPFFDSTSMIYMHWVPTGQSTRNTMLRF